MLSTYIYSVRVCISLYVLYLDYDNRMISVGQLGRSPPLYYTIVVVVVVVVFTLKTVLTSIQYPSSLSDSSRQRNEFPWSQANPK